MRTSTMSSPISSNSVPTGRNNRPRRNAALVRLVSRFRIAFAAVFAVVAFVAGSRAFADDLNDYPTSARADYVFGCMKANGDTQRSLEQCSCSIDIIASIVPYDRYVTAETVLRMAQVRGNLGGEFRSTEQARAAVDDLRRAQAEAEVRCF